MKKIFLAFGGRKDENKGIDKIIEKDNLVLLNLEEIDSIELQTFLDSHNIALPHIKIDIHYDKETIPSWGIIYEFSEDEGYVNFEFILELFLNNFLNPIFKVDELGFEKLGYNYIDTFNDGYLSKIDIEKLYIFFNEYKGIANYLCWYRPRIYEWVKNNDKESFRIYTGVYLYSELKKYNYRKSVHFWKKEVMEMGILLETLFTQPDEKESIGYALKKRIHYLSIEFIDDIEDKIKKLYSTRSNFVHGSLFSELIKEYELVGDKEDEDIREIVSSKMFEVTYEYITILRKILLLYYKIFEGILNGDYNSFFVKGKKITCIDVIELSVFNSELRSKFQSNVKLLNELIEY